MSTLSVAKSAAVRLSLRNAATVLVLLAKTVLKRCEQLLSDCLSVVPSSDESPKVRKHSIKRKSLASTRSDSASLRLPSLANTPSIRSPSDFSPLHTPDAFGPEEVDDGASSAASLRKRPRLSLLSQVLDELRGEVESVEHTPQIMRNARDSEVTMYDDGWGDEIDEVVPERQDALPGRKFKKPQLTRKAVSRKTVNQKEFGAKLSGGLLLLTKSVKAQVVENEEYDYDGFDGDQDDLEYSEEPEIYDHQNQAVGLKQLTLLEAAIRANSSDRKTLGRFFVDLLSLESEGGGRMQIDRMEGFLRPQEIRII